MLIVHVPTGVAPFQVDVPEKLKIPRSNPKGGAIHIRPGTLELNDAEWAHLKAKAPQTARFRVETPAAAAPPPVATPTREPAAPVAPEEAKAAGEDEKPEKRPKR